MHQGKLVFAQLSCTLLLGQLRDLCDLCQRQDGKQDPCATGDQRSEANERLSYQPGTMVYFESQSGKT
jgi:hypothetical protein